ncbi:TolC family protein [Synechococcus sp. A10-1-5-1]|uniref:TolC family protein n=1 Tax=Synechococcus sp. A10-1-5-1 TaxID=2936507 RepID=UPI0020016227|nr:TolC family protein [Synechococcus sp. A10-1-5-1]UPM49706.1 TolC family protein [Synechococcus sp. A10-1-5-1]
MGRLVNAVVAATGVALSGLPAVVLAAEPEPATKLELIDPPAVPLPSAFSTKGQRPKSDPTVLPPAATKLDPSLQRLAAPATLALPDKTDQVKIVELRPLSLLDVENLAEVNNPNLKAVASRADQAQSNLRATIAAWYPSFDFTTGNQFPSWTYGRQYNYLSNAIGSATEGGNTQTNRWAATANLGFNWDLINPQRVPQVSAARDAFEQAKNTYLIALRDLRLQASQAYFELQLSDDNVRIGQTSVQASVVSLRDARARFQAGVATKLEVLEAETQLARDQNILTEALAEQANARRDLARLLDLPQNITPTAKQPLRPLGVWMPSLQESIIGAYAFREELDNALLDISVSNSNANASLGAVQPFLSIINNFVTGRTFGFAGLNPDRGLDAGQTWATDNTVGLNLRWSIFDGGRARAQYRQSKQQAQENAFRFADTRDQVRFQVEQSFNNLRANTRTIQTTSREVLSARESLRLARLRFQAGVTTQREVVDNQRDLTQAQLRYARALASYNSGLSELRRRTGLDQITICQPPKLSAIKPLEDDTYSVPVPPEPLPPACQAAYPSAKGS